MLRELYITVLIFKSNKDKCYNLVDIVVIGDYR